MKSDKGGALTATGITILVLLHMSVRLADTYVELSDKGSVETPSSLSLVRDLVLLAVAGYVVAMLAIYDESEKGWKISLASTVFSVGIGVYAVWVGATNTGIGFNTSPIQALGIVLAALAVVATWSAYTAAPPRARITADQPE